MYKTIGFEDSVLRKIKDYEKIEEEILKDILYIREFTRGATTIFVSHRLSAVRKADRIIVMDQGRIVEDGVHDELMRLNGKYARIQKNQALAMEMEITLQ